MFFISSYLYGFEFLFSILSFQPEELPLAFLLGQVYWQQTPSALVYLGMSSFLLYFWRIAFLDIELLVNSFFFQHFKLVIPMPSAIHDFWWKVNCQSYWVSLISDDLSLAAFKILSLLFYSLIYNVSQCGLTCLMFMCLESTQIKDHNNGPESNDYNLMIIMIMNDPSV